jgi:hypothetical protein
MKFQFAKKSQVRRSLKALAALSMLAWGATATLAQPTPAPTTGDAVCAAEPGAGSTDTVASQLDADGFYSLFNGKDFTGWWNSCLTGHSDADKAHGAIFRVDAAKAAIYSTQRGTNVGGVLMTKRKYTNYEIVFDYWPDYGNDGGLFNRTSADGRCYQTVLDYIASGSLGGVWGEGGFTHRDLRPFGFSGAENTISLATGKGDSWTLITSKLNPTSFGCPSTGCTQTEWRALWNMDDWNQIRIKFYDGVTAGRKVHMLSWFRKVGAEAWVPVIQDTVFNSEAVPAGYIGLQVHGGGRFGGAKGTWYRNIKWRPLDIDGNPTTKPVGIGEPAGRTGSHGLKISGGRLLGNMDVSYEIRVKDMRGRTLADVSGPAGEIRQALPSQAKGALSLEIKTPAGTEFGLLNRIAE